MDKLFLWLYSVVSIGNKELLKIYKNFLDTDEKVDSEDEDIASILEKIVNMKNLSKKSQLKISKCPFSESVLANLIFEMKKRNISYISIFNENYPTLLKRIYDPPTVIFFQGDIGILNNRKLFSVVGSRKSSEYGRNVTKLIVKKLANFGILIVSGMAEGIDAYAHEYCMEGGSPTIAVLGSSLDNPYPKKNIGLMKRIIENGGVVLSEHNFEEKTIPAYFALRNRIISGLSEGVLVTEAEEKSGTLITVESALSEGRNVYAVPGSIFSKKSQGCNNLIIEGAKPVQCAEDVLEDIVIGFDRKYKNAGKEMDEKESEKSNSKNLLNKFEKNTGNNTGDCVNILQDGTRNDVEDKILVLLEENGALNIDGIIKISELPEKIVISEINKLQLIDRVVEIGVNTYALNI